MRDAGHIPQENMHRFVDYLGKKHPKEHLQKLQLHRSERSITQITVFLDMTESNGKYEEKTGIAIG